MGANKRRVPGFPEDAMDMSSTRRQKSDGLFHQQMLYVIRDNLSPATL
jgi:hypothetical protein